MMKDELYEAYASKVKQIEASSGDVARGLFNTSCLVRILAQVDLYGSIRPSDVLDIIESSEQLLNHLREPVNADV